MTTAHTTDTPPLTFAAAPYLNSAPLTEGLRTRDQITLIEQPPSTLVDLLTSRQADVALIPVVDLFTHPELTMIDGLGVAADGKVASVILRCACAPDQVTQLLPDTNSHTSNLLAQLLLRQHWGAPSVRLSPDHTHANATVIIGDRALKTEPNGETIYDLAEEWQRMTGLPFVFAVWAYRRDHEHAATLSRIATESYAAGGNALDAIANRFAERLNLTPDFCRRYLTQNIQYRITAREQQAMAQFKAQLTDQGFILRKETILP